MKKCILFLLVVICFTSCNCPYCDHYPCICHCEYVEHKGYSNYSSSDYFSAAILIGEWQMVGNNDTQYMNGCGLIPKDIVFSEQAVGSLGRCTMTCAIGNQPQWYEVDLAYNYVRRELTFYHLNDIGKWEKFISFTYKNFLFPTVTVQDSFGTYEWRKVRVTTSN